MRARGSWGLAGGGRRLVGCAAAGLAVLFAGQTAAAASAPESDGRFVGVNAGALFQPGPSLGLRPGAVDAELRLMARVGVRSLRIGLWWKYIQPYPTWAQVPRAQRRWYVRTPGAPTSFVFADALFAAAARRGLTLLPVLGGAPAWAAVNPEPRGEVIGNPPRDLEAFASWSGLMVARYGSRGAFWAEHPELPHRPPGAWQVWNEPNIWPAWSAPDWVHGYAALLHATAPAIRAADPAARIVLAGLTNESWTALDQLYGAVDRSDFDVVAIHPYTLYTANLIKIARRARAVMTAHGDGARPLWLTEVGWPAASRRLRARYGIETDATGQVARMRAILPALLRRRAALGLQHVYWESWATRYRQVWNPFDFAGLRRVGRGRIVPAAAFGAFRAVLRSIVRAGSAAAARPTAAARRLR